MGADEFYDTDGDEIPDYWEVTHGLDPSSGDAGNDPDSDGLSNLGEYQNNTDPFNSDTDGDGISDSDEVAAGSDPRKWSVFVVDGQEGNDSFTGQRSIDRFVTTLRNKIEPDPHNPIMIHTIREIGYKFEPPE